MIIRTIQNKIITRSFVIGTSTQIGISASESSSQEGAEPEFYLGPDIRITTLTPGRFSNVIGRNTNFMHSLQQIRENETSSLTLDLRANGCCTLTRGWRYLFFNEGPDMHNSEKIREQLGYRGHWKQQGAWINLDITQDDSVCPRVGEYSGLVPNHSPEWRLRCLPIAPKDHPVLSMPVLICQLSNNEPVFGEDAPHVVGSVLPGWWIVLGQGNGLRIEVETDPINVENAPVVRINNAAEQVQTNAWERSF